MKLKGYTTCILRQNKKCNHQLRMFKGNLVVFIGVFPYTNINRRGGLLMTLGRKIQQLRKEKGFSQERLATEIGFQDKPFLNGN